MSEAPIAGLSGTPSATNVRQAIAQASERTGVDFQYLLAQAKLESSLDPMAKARTSSAAGLYQFTRGTWLQTLDRHAGAHGLDWAGDAISGSRITDQGLASRIMALRYDANASALMAAELASDNKDHLTGVLGRKPDAAELYLGHFFGSGGATRFLKALEATPDRAAASVLPRAAAANRSIFYQRSGAARSVSGVMDLIRAKMSAAMEDSGTAWAVVDPPARPVADTSASRFANSAPVRAFGAAQARFETPAPRSMADTLDEMFSASLSGSGGRAAEHVRAAYDQLRRFGL